MMIDLAEAGSRTDVLVLGSVNRDEFLYVDRLPNAGETTLARSTSVSLGGKGANQAAAAGKLGASVLFLGQVGHDDAGSFVHREFARLRIPTRLVAPLPTTATGRAVISVDEQGENSIVVAAGANAALTANDVRTLMAEKAVASSLRPGTICLAQGETPAGATAAFALSAAESGLRFVLNLAPVIEIPSEVIGAADPLVVNEGEARALAQSLLTNEIANANTVTAIGLAALIANGHAKSVVITLGGDGAVASDGEQTWHQPAPDPGEVVDTTGAGDCFVGAMVAALSAGKTLRGAVSLGVAAGSFAVRSNGTTESYPSTKDLDPALSPAFGEPQQ
jgi:ribokinase